MVVTFCDDKIKGESTRGKKNNLRMYKIELVKK
jgi:hypothetical protein